jgi:hypothetical protein
MTGIAESVAAPSYSGLSDTPPVSASADPSWNVVTRIAFRFGVIYFGIYILTTQMASGLLPVPSLRVPELSKRAPLSALVHMTGNALGLKPTIHPTGSGDTLYDWVFAVTGLIVAGIGTAIWTAAARRTTSHTRLFKWFRLFLRLGLGTTLLLYGFIKVFPLQMGTPAFQLTRLLEPYGDFSPMGVIWSSIGSSPGYQRFIGSAEVIAGLLLIVPWTALIGALVAFGVTTGVFMVNMTYDVPVKLFSLHLVVMSVFLIAPDMRRLADWFVMNRAVAPRPHPRYGSTARTQRVVNGLQVAFAVWASAFLIYGNLQSWKAYGGGAAKSPLYGIWDVDTMTVDGVVRPPLATDTTRFSHVVFQQATGRVSFQRMDQKFTHFTGTADTIQHVVRLLRGQDSSFLNYERPILSNTLRLEGKLDRRPVRMTMTRRDLDKVFLRSRGFNWVQEYPINR